MLRIKLPELRRHADRPVVDTMISAGLSTVPLLCDGAPTKNDLR